MLYLLRRLRGGFDRNTFPFELFDHGLGACIALARKLGGFSYERLYLRPSLLRLLHRRFEVPLQLAQITSLEYKLHGLEAKPDKQGNDG